LVADDDGTIWALDDSRCDWNWTRDKNLWFGFWGWDGVSAGYEGDDSESLKEENQN
jgi:hypothetical protein